MPLALLGLLALAAGRPASGQVLAELGPDVAIGAIAPSPEPGSQTQAAIAQGTGGYLAAWRDGRAVVTRALTDQGRAIQGTSTVLDEEAFGAPAVAFGDGVFLVVWADLQGDIYGRTVTPDAEPLAPERIPIALGRDVEEPKVIWAGSRFVVTWGHDSAYEGLSAVAVTREGVVTAPARLLIPDDAAFASFYAAVAGPVGEWIVVWSEARDIGDASSEDVFVRRFDESLEPLGEPLHLVAAEENQVAVGGAFNGDRYLIFWLDSRSASYPQLRSATVSSDLSTIGPVTTTPSAGYNLPSDFQITSDGTGFVAVWLENGVAARRFSSEGVPLESESETIHTFYPHSPLFSGRGDPEVAGNAEGYVVVFADMRTPEGTEDVYARWLPTGLSTPGPLRSLSTAANAQRLPRMASAGESALVVWEDFRHTAWDYYLGAADMSKPNTELYFGRWSSEGGELREERRLTRSRWSQSYPDVAWTGRSYLVAWADPVRSEVGLRRVTEDAKIAGIEREVGTRGVDSEPQVAGGRGRGFLVWASRRSSETLMAVPIDRRSRLGYKIVLARSSSGNRVLGDVVHVGARFLAVWTDSKAPSIGQEGDEIGVIRTRTVAMDGTDRSRPRTVAKAPYGIWPRAAAGDGRVLLTWLTQAHIEEHRRVQGVILDYDGKPVAAPFWIAEEALSAAEVVWSGKDFVVAVHQRDAADNHRLEAIRVTRDGEVTARNGFAFEGLSLPAAHQIGLGRIGQAVMVAYERPGEGPLCKGSPRLFARTLR